MKPVNLFNIQNASDFFEHIVTPEYNDFLNNNASPRHAIFSIISMYHMYEWVHDSQKFTSEDDFLLLYPEEKKVSDYLEITRRVTNSTKHFKWKIDTKRQSGFSSAFSSDFARPLIIIEDDSSEVSVVDLLCTLFSFWKEHCACSK